MLGSKKVVCIIPARLASTRLPKKILAPLAGKPLIQWVWEAANKVELFDEIAFAIDDEETAKVITKFGGRFYMTSKECLNGTQRLIELQKSNRVKSDFWVDWQGDEPFITPSVINELLQSCGKDDADVWTLCKKITNTHEIFSPHIAKVVRNRDNEALYFSRSPIPYIREERFEGKQIFYKHIGMYAFSSAGLEKIGKVEPCEIEVAEQLEQLRFLYAKLKIKVHETEHEIFGIDIPAHLEAAENFIEQRQKSLI
ncbi:MAG TPA: 3-deoxy-manno-octulosonate cytidylyltransferase [Rhabdochlamydiaceae bacterium]|nr:3-deoxy-manno-octulosonate cytidylyltransferase [Rhabdochlamydiaceae bacterium]